MWRRQILPIYIVESIPEEMEILIDFNFYLQNQEN